MALKLHSGERILFEGHPSWRSILGFYLKGILISAIVAGIAAGITRLADGEVSKGVVGAIFLIGVGLTLLIGFIRRVATDYTVTNRRLHIKRGIVSREIQETRLERVQNVNYSQSIYERFMQIGTVEFDTAAGEDYEFNFAGVGDPGDVVHQVDQATGAQHPLGDPPSQPAQPPPAQGQPGEQQQS